MRRVVFLLVALTAFAAVAQSSDAASSVPKLVRLTSTPALFPSFSPTVTDYVVRCAGQATTQFTTWAAAGTVPTIDGTRERSAKLPLKPGQSVTIGGMRAGKSITYHVRCLPADFPAWQTSGPGTTSRFYVTAPSLSLGTAQAHYVVIFDGHGVPVWWYRDADQPIDAKLLPDGSLAWAEFNGSSPAYQVRTLGGKLERRITSPDGAIDDHELQIDANGDAYYLVYQPQQHVDLTPLGGPADATVFNGEIEELSPTGKLLWSWSTAGHIALDELRAWTSTIVGAPVTVAGSSVYDIVHANAISVSGHTLLLSLRYADAVYAIDRDTGAIQWKLGGTPTSQSLALTGDPLDTNPLVGQHDVRALPDGTITVFDDGSFVRAPRAVHYRIDAAAKTATYLSSVTDPEITASPCCGSARLLDDGHWLVSWGGDSTVGEYAPDGTPVLKLTFPGLFSYRAVPVAASKLSPAALRAGMDAMAHP